MAHPVTRRDLLKSLGIALGAGALSRAGFAAARRPNFVVIYCDDLGYGDLGCYGAEKIKTPRLDAMAAEGARFTDFYSAAAVCSPSRAALLTGRLPVRAGMNRVLFPQSPDGLDPSDTTIAELLKPLGYTSGCVGKWHLGHLPQYLPTNRGFDYYFGLPYSNDMTVEKRGDPPLPLMRNMEIAAQPADQDTLTRVYTEEAAAFIERSKDRPFFLYLAHSMPHVPIHCSDAFKGKSAGGRYGDVIEEIDWSVGEVLDALKRNGLDGQTLVVFSSDNGPWLVKGADGGSAGPLREGKGTTFEGGVREPGIFRWPGHIGAGRVVRDPAITMDLLPTFVALAGGALPEGRLFDGRDISGLLEGRGRRDGDEFFFYLGEQLQAVRAGRWKLKRPFKGQIYGKPAEHGFLLFNLEKDPGEKVNLAGEFPERVRRLEERMKEFERNLGEVPPTKR